METTTPPSPNDPTLLHFILGPYRDRSAVNELEDVVEDEITAVGREELEDLGVVHRPLLFVNLEQS